MISPLDALGSNLTVPEAAREGDLAQEDFLHLMLTQLKNQDPFKPLESGEFLGQLAQFGTVQGLAGLQTSFDDLKSSLVSNQALQAATLVGRTALAETSTLTVAKGQPVSGAVDLPESAPAVKVEVRDALGQTIRTLTLGSHPAGLATFEWDGLDAEGKPAPAGSYTFAATYQASTETVVADTLLRAPVDSVLLGAKGFSVELRGVGEVPFTAVREIRSESSSDAQAAAGATD